MEKLLLIVFVSLLSYSAALSQINIDHNSTNLIQVPEEWITAAKTELHIAYGHTSHGSQLTDGMTGLVTFTGGVGGPQFDWNDGGSNGALDLHDYAMGGDCGYYPDWVVNTRAYLDDPGNADVNVIIWSWCGQISTYSEQDLIDKYINPMVQLEADYPGVKFVYMTGHLYFDLYENTTLRNQQLRDFCKENNKILFDFADIESYDPDGVYYQFANDNCDYYENADPGIYLGNWAINWQDSHVEGVDWYNCGSAHSQPLNANRKAYAAWHLWARLAGWSGTTGTGDLVSQDKIETCPNPAVDYLLVNLFLDKNTIGNVEILDYLGHIRKSLVNEDLTRGNNKIYINIADLKPGFYFLRFSDAHTSTTCKFLIIR
jgi:hypothetical protein